MPPVNMSLDAHFKSPNLERLVVGKKLTNARIRHYQSLGFYARPEPYRKLLKATPRKVVPLSTQEMIKRLLH